MPPTHAEQNVYQVPFNTDQISAAVLMNQKPHDDTFLRQKAFVLQLRSDGQPLLRFKPVNIDFEQLEIRGEEVWELRIDFKFDMSRARQQIMGQENLALWLEIDESHMQTEHKNEPFTIL